MIRYQWKIKYQSPLGRSVIRNVEIKAYRDGRARSCETPMRVYGSFELRAKKKVPTEVLLPITSPIYVYYDTINGIIGDQSITNKKYERIKTDGITFLTKTDHVPLRVFALGMSYKIVNSNYLYNQSQTAIIKATNRYLSLPIHQEFEFITLPLYYGYNKDIMNEIIKIGIRIKEERYRPLAGFIDLRDSKTFSVFKKLIEDNRIYSHFDLILIKWGNPDKFLSDYFFIEDLLRETYSHEQYEDFPPIMMVATLRKSDDTLGLSGIHYTHIFGGDLHNVDRPRFFGKKEKSFPNIPLNPPLNPPSFFEREELTIHPINDEKLDEIKNHYIVKRYAYLREVLDNFQDWTLSRKHLSSANGLAYLLETYDSSDEFNTEHKYLKNDEIDEYYAQKTVLKSKSKNVINIQPLLKN